ncbi:ArsR family transcriptional regulator [Streptomyces sp. CB00316]|uniref:ArsR/SmtB family transcription factor n=1 Tax=unclassified Streptomyces TaxID=2593676 RepID=UPI00093FABD8|nr:MULTISPECIES: metalloregulator ArsR/SmtB family transcription factor [unclassified Streptomyces]MBT2377039.1 winged helix-turn-helix transcriptional regulator [Streptomyces sp. ISL-111]MBT2425556.1 winged helix-turn-helix transcriptional regulator [Streptomyces sp. ISL-112]MBT2463685.1 winged helix-turn-helix transcriptional regulator [Streptomyces sp. ISL-63]OKJ18800.1 ArsR family transcriptional regulator [Streptomyces sp. CB00316]
MAITAYEATKPVVDDEASTCVPQLSCLLIDREEAERMAGALKAIADPTRLQILRLIERSPTREACVCDLTDCLGLRQPTVSHHLKIMMDAGILTRERRGTWAWFSVDPEGLRRIRDILEPTAG